MSTQILRWPQFHKNKDILLREQKQGPGLTAAAHMLQLERYREDQRGLSARTTHKFMKCFIFSKKAISENNVYRVPLVVGGRIRKTFIFACICIKKCRKKCTRNLRWWFALLRNGGIWVDGGQRKPVESLLYKYTFLKLNS